MSYRPSKHQMLHDKRSLNKIIVHFLWKVGQNTNYLHFFDNCNKKNGQNVKGSQVISY